MQKFRIIRLLKQMIPLGVTTDIYRLNEVISHGGNDMHTLDLSDVNIDHTISKYLDFDEFSEILGDRGYDASKDDFEEMINNPNFIKDAELTYALTSYEIKPVLRFLRKDRIIMRFDKLDLYLQGVMNSILIHYYDEEASSAKISTKMAINELNEMIDSMDVLDILIFADLKSAYSSCSLDVLIHLLKHCGFDIIANYLIELSKYICKLQDDQLPWNFGIPLGSPLGHILMTLYMQNISMELSRYGIYTVSYSDDIVFLLSVNNLDLVDKIENVFAKYGLIFNYDKTQVYANGNADLLENYKHNGLLTQFNYFDNIDLYLGAPLNIYIVDYLNYIFEECSDNPKALSSRLIYIYSIYEDNIEEYLDEYLGEDSSEDYTEKDNDNNDNNDTKDKKDKEIHKSEYYPDIDKTSKKIKKRIYRVAKSKRNNDTKEDNDKKDKEIHKSEYYPDIDKTSKKIKKRIYRVAKSKKKDKDNNKSEYYPLYR